MKFNLQLLRDREERHTYWPLIYNGRLYPAYRMNKAGELDEFDGRSWSAVSVHNGDRRTSRPRYFVRHPITGKWHWINAARACQGSILGIDMTGFVAAHNAGYPPDAFSFESCSVKTQKQNRADRIRDKTESTGRNTQKKLTKAQKQNLTLRLGERPFDLAREFDVTPQAIYYYLKKAAKNSQA